MQYIPSKKIAHADCLLKLILKSVELLEETMIVSLQPENELRSIVSNIIQELPVTVHDIKMESIEDTLQK